MKFKAIFKIKNVFIFKRLNLHNKDYFNLKNNFKIHLDTFDIKLHPLVRY